MQMNTHLSWNKDLYWVAVGNSVALSVGHLVGVLDWLLVALLFYMFLADWLTGVV